MNTPIATLLALVGIALPALHLGSSQDEVKDEAEDEDEKVTGDDVEQVAMAATYFRIADYDKNEWISFREARDSLGIDRRRFSVYDENRDGRITLEEFTKVFLNTVEKLGSFPPPVPNPDDPNAPTLGDLLAEAEAEAEGVPVEEAIETPPPTSVLELLGTVIPRGVDDRGAPQPGRIAGPVPSFRRIDYDADGGISHADLELLARGSGLDLRLNTLLASLDLNGDEVIDREEFLASMGSAP